MKCETCLCGFNPVFHLTRKKNEMLSQETSIILY